MVRLGADVNEASAKQADAGPHARPTWGRVWADVRRLEAHELAFLALVFSVPFMWPVDAHLLGQAVILTDALFAVAVLVAGWAVLTRRLKPRVGPFLLALAPYMATTVVATVTSADVHRSTAKLVGELYLFGLGGLTYTVVTTRERLDRVLRVWLAATAISVAGVAVSLFAFVLGARDPGLNPVLWHTGSLPPGPYPRVRAFFLNGNMACTYLVIGFCLIAAAPTWGLLRRRTAATLAAATAVAAAFTLSPALGGLALAAGTVGWAFAGARGRPWTGRLVATAGALAAVAMLAVTAVYPAPGTLTDAAGLQLEPSPRLRTWRGALGTLAEHPLSGVGLGVEVANVHYETFAGQQQRLTDAHNAWLNIGAQQGLPGLAAFAGLVAFLVWRNRPRPVEGLGRHETPGLTAVRPALLLALVAGFLYPSLSGSFEDTRHMWLLMGLLGATADARGPSRQQ